MRSIILIFIIAGAFFLYNSILIEHEKGECLSWRDQPELVMYAWQVDQCLALDVSLMLGVAQKD